MAKIGFLDYDREQPQTRDVKERIEDYKDLYKEFSDKKVQKQSDRCMDCGTPFCHYGCPIGNNIPEFNEEVHKGNWAGAYKVLSATNNLPEMTGRICPAPCEASCVLGLINPQVSIELIEKTIIEKAFKNGYVKPEIPEKRTGKKVAIVGSGPAGLSAAMQLNKAGHNVTVFERDDRAGGLLRYGIPDFKLEKWVVDRRIELMEQSGIEFKLNCNVGFDVKGEELKKEYDVVLLTGGSTIPRDLPIKGRELNGVHFAMDFLKQQNKVVSELEVKDQLMATGKNVVVIGGGDTGSDCVGTSNRHKAKSVTQLELMPMPPKERSVDNPWPEWWRVLKTSTSHDEGCDRKWSILTKEFIGDEKGNLKALKVVDIEWEGGKFTENPETEREIPCELTLLAMGFVHPQHEGVVAEFGLELDERGNVKCDNYETSVENVYAAGDMRIGQSLVVRAIAEGREAANFIDEKLSSYSILETSDRSIIGV
jgi:glutamate synthase (NADPH/NADH) small chain